MTNVSKVLSYREDDGLSSVAQLAKGFWLCVGDFS